MRTALIALLTLAAAPAAHAADSSYYNGPMTQEIYDLFSGRYDLTKPTPELPEFMGRGYIELTQDHNGRYLVQHRVACGTKVTPGIYAVENVVCNTFGTNTYCDIRLKLEYEGSSLCFLGNSPTLDVANYSPDRVTLFGGFQTPGFRGNYSFERSQR